MRRSALLKRGSKPLHPSAGNGSGSINTEGAVGGGVLKVSRRKPKPLLPSSAAATGGLIVKSTSAQANGTSSKDKADGDGGGGGGENGNGGNNTGAGVKKQSKKSKKRKMNNSGLNADGTPLDPVDAAALERRRQAKRERSKARRQKMRARARERAKAKAAAKKEARRSLLLKGSKPKPKKTEQVEDGGVDADASVIETGDAPAAPPSSGGGGGGGGGGSQPFDIDAAVYYQARYMRKKLSSNHGARSNGFLVLDNDKLYLKNKTGKTIGKKNLGSDVPSMEAGKKFSLGNKSVEIVCELDRIPAFARKMR